MAVKSRIRNIEKELPLTVSKAIKEGTEAIAAAAAAKAPYRTGDLKRSIEARRSSILLGGRSEFVTSGQAAALGFNVPHGARHQAHDVAYGVWAAWYWYFVEYGTASGGKDGGPQPARPFLVPAAEAGWPALQSNVKKALRDL